MFLPAVIQALPIIWGGIVEDQINNNLVKKILGIWDIYDCRALLKYVAHPCPN